MAMTAVIRLHVHRESVSVTLDIMYLDKHTGTRYDGAEVISYIKGV